MHDRYSRQIAGIVGFVLLVGSAIGRVSGQEKAAVSLAERIVTASNAAGGMCAVLGAADPELGCAVAKVRPFTAQCLSGDPATTLSLRKRIQARGLYGTVSAATLRAGRLPYTDNLMTLIILTSAEVSRRLRVVPGELFRVLAPLGTVHVIQGPAGTTTLVERLMEAGFELLSGPAPDGVWLSLRKPWPDSIDEWTHYLHGADGNPVASDTVVGPPAHYQWISRPRWMRSHETDSSISTMVTARGRLFYIVDDGPISLAGQHSLPDKWSLAARDAFNGVLLWKVPIRRWGWREWKGSWFNTRPGDIPLNIQKRLVAVGDRVYVTLGYQAPVSELDARTGSILRSFSGTEGTNEILAVDGMLILSILAEGGVRIAAVDVRSGGVTWKTEEVYRGTVVDYIKWKEMHGGITPPVLDPSLNTATDGKIVALIDGPDLVCVGASDGNERWRAAFPTEESDLRAGGIKSGGNLWIGTMIVSHDVVLHASPSKLAGFSSKTGRLLWSQPKRYIQHLWYEWKDVFVIDGVVWTWNAELARARSLYPTSVKGYNILTGELIKTVPLGTIFSTHHHHRCYRNKATSRYILASRRGTEFVDLIEGAHTVHNWVRGTCHMGMMPANGLHYAPPHPCQCYIDEKLNGMNALAARGDAVKPVVFPEEARLQRGPAYGSSLGPRAGSEDWPAFRHDAMRTGAAATSLGKELQELWRTRVGGTPSAPVAVGRQVVTARVDAHQVLSLDAATGSVEWTFTAGGRVDSPPTYDRGRLYFGSADGWVYCLRARDGMLVWRYLAAPDVRLIGAFGQLESAWPVHGSVVVHEGIVYAAAGRSSQLDGGIRLCGLDAVTGAVRHRTVVEGPHYAVGDFKENYQLPMGALADILMCDGEKIFMRSETFDRELQRVKEPAPLSAPGGFLDDSYFKRIPWRLQKDYARLIVHDSRSAYYVRMFDTLRGLDPTVFFTPGREGYLLFAKHMKGGKGTWNTRLPVRVRAMVLAGEMLAVAGPPDVVDPRDPLGAFEGRKGGLLYLIDANSGEKTWEHQLPSPPVFNGAAAAGKRLYVVSEDGAITCFGL